MMGRWSKKPESDDVKPAPLASNDVNKTAPRPSTVLPPLKTPPAGIPPPLASTPPAKAATIAERPVQGLSKATGNDSPGVPQPPAAPGRTTTPISVFGDIVWLMGQSPAHKHFFISDLDWFAMPAIVLGQVCIFRSNGPNGPNDQRPIGAVMWAFVGLEVSDRLKAGASRLRPQDWKSGEEPWIVHVIAPFGGAEQMVKDLKVRTFADRELRYLSRSEDGKIEAKVA